MPTASPGTLRSALIGSTCSTRQYPFYQRAGYVQNEPSSANRLVKELSRGNNAALFDHTTDDPPMALTPQRQHVAVITEQVFAYSAGPGEER